MYRVEGEWSDGRRVGSVRCDSMVGEVRILEVNVGDAACRCGQDDMKKVWIGSVNSDCGDA